MHVLIADPIQGEIVSSLEALGYQVTLAPDTDLTQSAKNTDVLVVGKTRVTRHVIEGAPRLKAIMRAGVGVDSIDVQAASERGITVGHCPNADVHARAEHVLALMLALDRGLARPEPQVAHGLRGRTIGLVGFDAAARAVQAAAAAMGMRVLVWDPSLTPAFAAEFGVHRADSIDAVFGRADVVSLHLAERPGGPVVTAQHIERLPQGAMIINAGARGLIDLAAAKSALEAGRLRLGLDAYDANDFGDDVPFAADAYPGLLATFRRAGHTRECDEAVAHAVVHALEMFLAERVLPDAANLGAGRDQAARGHLIIRHRADPGVLPAIFEALQEHSATVISVDARGYEGGAAGLVRIELALAVTPALVDELDGLSGVIGVESR